MGQHDARAIDGRAIEDRWSNVGLQTLACVLLDTRCGLGLLGGRALRDPPADVRLRSRVRAPPLARLGDKKAHDGRVVAHGHVRFGQTGRCRSLDSDEGPARRPR